MSSWGAVVNKAFQFNQGILRGKPNVLTSTATPHGDAAFTAKLGTLCWDVSNGNAYINTNGATNWTKINA
jgi:hypothetical protein